MSDRPTPLSERPSQEDPLGGEEPRRVSRRTVAKGMAWATPTVMLASAAPSFAASPPDVVVDRGRCGNATPQLNTIPFSVRTIHAATLQPGTVFTVQYAGGSTRPSWSGTLAENSTVTIRPGNDTSTNGGAVGINHVRS